MQTFAERPKLFTSRLSGFQKMKKILHYILFLALLLILLPSCGKSHSGNGLNPEFKPGTVVGRVTVRADTLQTYALFVPSGYSGDTKWPLVICFDPHAEGLLPVNLFKAQAEKYGFILAGSNNSKNGLSLDETTGICRNMLEDLKQRFAVDDSVIYLAGFSGGSRVAGSIALTEGTIAGVIGCGAGLPNLNQRPVRKFSYLAVAGTKDFNYSELRQLDDVLESAGFTHYMLEFDGPHAWPPDSLTSPIFTWIQFDRMRNGSLPADRDAINRFIDQTYSNAEKAGKTDLLRKVSILKMMKHYLDGLTDTTPLQDEIDRLEKDPGVKKLEENQALLFEKENYLKEGYARQLQTESLGWWSQEAAKLRKMANAPSNSAESAMYQRVLGFLSMNSYSLSNSALKMNDLTAADHAIGLYEAVDPENPEHRYMAATVSIKKGNSSLAINQLSSAIKLGFKDFTRLKNDPIFTPLHGNPQFQKLFPTHP